MTTKPQRDTAIQRDTAMLRDTEAKSRDMSDFKREIKEWLFRNHLSKKWLAEVLGVQHGTVRNWLSSEMRIGQATCEKIRDLMKRPTLEGVMPAPARHPAFLPVPPDGAEVLMWLSAAGVVDGSILSPMRIRTSLTHVRGDQATFAAWATPIINNEIKLELNEHPAEDVQKRVSVRGGTASALSDVMGSGEISDKLVVYVNRSSINLAFLKAAADFKAVSVGEFVRDALNAAVLKTFANELSDFLKDN